jgi:hypothetical protein
MPHTVTTVAAITVPSTDPLFLLIVAFHIPLGLVSALAGLMAMLSPKRRGRHPTWGTVYFWSVTGIFVTATALSLMRWRDDYHLFVLGALTWLAAWLGRTARRRRAPRWARLHIAAMGFSYVLLLTAFYVDNGKQLPLWRDLPVWTYWALPATIGVPVILWALLRHPSAKESAKSPRPVAS